MFLRGIWHVLMDQANAGEGGGSSAGAPEGSTAEGASSVPAGGEADTGAAQQPGQSNAATALSQGAEAGQAVAIPEKYQVKKEDGSLDIEASSLKLAEAYGHVGMLIERASDVEPALREARKLKDRTVFMDFRTDPTENVFPMVQAGKGITEMLLGSEDL